MSTLAELERNMLKLDSRLTEIEQVFGASSVTAATWRAEFSAVARDVVAMKANQTWFVRVVLGALAVAFLTFATQGGLTMATHMTGH